MSLRSVFLGIIWEAESVVRSEPENGNLKTSVAGSAAYDLTRFSIISDDFRAPAYLN